jgi:hypothetical protein
VGVKIDSPDEESKLTIKWFCEECKMEELPFLSGGRPFTTEEFCRKDKKVNLISQMLDAKERFRRRLGNFEDRFFDMIPKSLAFKPMVNVKDFINKFELSGELIKLQLSYCSKYDCYLGSGDQQMQEYVTEHHKLVAG